MVVDGSGWGTRTEAVIATRSKAFKGGEELEDDDDDVTPSIYGTVSGTSPSQDTVIRRTGSKHDGNHCHMKMFTCTSNAL